jgi:hypothetical protein
VKGRAWSGALTSSLVYRASPVHWMGADSLGMGSDTGASLESGVKACRRIPKVSTSSFEDVPFTTEGPRQRHGMRENHPYIAVYGSPYRKNRPTHTKTAPVAGPQDRCE